MSQERKYITWEDELYEEKRVKAGMLGKEKRYNEAIIEAKSLLALCDPDDNVSVLWASMPIVLGFMSIANANNKDPEPGSVAYNDLHKYLKILLTAYENSTEEVQEEYRRIDINFKHYYEIFDLLEKNLPLSEPVIQQSKKSGCFIATAVYGSPYENEVLILKKFRDNWLMKYKLGEIFVKLYYWFSPPIANLIAKSNSLRRITKSILIIPLLKIVNSLKSKEK